MAQPTFAEFFAGGGMVRAALGAGWRCVLANDIDARKCDAYRRNWGDAALVQGDVAALDPALLDQPVDLYWASSPCQDFSAAGKGAGLAGARSSAFLAWAGVVRRAAARGHAPRIIGFENVTGLLNPSRAADMRDILWTLFALGYRVGALEIDARFFLPQSRPRLFLVALRDDLAPPPALCAEGPVSPFHTPRVRALAARPGVAPRERWIWWRVDPPAAPAAALADLLDDDAAASWFDEAACRRLVAMMSPAGRERVEKALRSGEALVGTLYRRGRPDGDGALRQRAEARFDGIAGCIRTPVGGSSRQTVVKVSDGRLRARLMTAREALRLMGLPDAYRAPEKYNDAYRLAGDGVCVPVVRRLRDVLLAPLLTGAANLRAA